MIWSVGQADPETQPATATSTAKSHKPRPTTGLTITESDFTEILRNLYKTGKYTELLQKTARIDFDEWDFSFCWEVMILQSEAYRRMGSHLAAETTARKLLKYIQKQPGPGKRRMVIRRSNAYGNIEGYWDFGPAGRGVYRHRPVEKVQSLSFLLEVYKCVRKGVYHSPRTGKPLQGSKPVSDNSAWEAAQRDYAQCALKHLDDVVKEKIGGVNSTDRLMSDLVAALRVIDVVRTHRPKQANAKAVPVINAFIKRYEKIAETPCKKSIKRVEKLRKREFWSKHQFMTLSQRKAIINKIWNTAKQLYVTNYKWGALITSYSRRYGFLPKVQPEIKKLAARRDKLEKSFVKLDEFIQRYYRTRSPSSPGSTPRSKIPTAPW